MSKLVLANGAFKSGSTWLREILLHLLEVATNFEFPSEYAVRGLPWWIRPERIDKFMKDSRSSDSVFISKSHIFLGNEVAQICRCENIYVINISRDSSDVAVSAFHHFSREFGIKIPFNVWYWLIGRYKVKEVCDYNTAWAGVNGSILCVTYEKLLTDFCGQVRMMTDFLGVLPLSAEQYDALMDKTSIRSLRIRAANSGSYLPPPEFFRVGQADSASKVISHKIKADIEKINSNQISYGFKIMYIILFRARREISRYIRWSF